MVPFRTILCPTDFSDCARGAFHLACSLAAFHGARLVVAHVLDVEYGKHTFGGIPVEVRPPNYPELTREALCRLEPPDPAVPVEHVLAQGQPVDEILRLARERRCDLIVLGTHGRTGLRRLLLGSVAEQVLRRSPCPVVTVPPAHGPEPAVTPADPAPEKVRP